MIMPVWAGVVDMGPAKLQTVLQFTDVTVRNINPCLEDIRGLVLPRDLPETITLLLIEIRTVGHSGNGVF